MSAAVARCGGRGNPHDHEKVRDGAHVLSVAVSRPSFDLASRLVGWSEEMGNTIGYGAAFAPVR